MSAAEIDMELVAGEWPAKGRNGIYLNSGSCGVKPVSVLKAIENGWKYLNENPTIATFLDREIWESARSIAASLFNCDASDLILTQNSTSGIQMVMQSLLLEPGDEILSTDMEHSCVRTLSSYLEQERGIVMRKHTIDAFAGSDKFCQGVVDLVSERTKLVLVSEVNCLSGWRPNLKPLIEEMDRRSIALLVDGAHGPGQGPLSISKYPFWVASGHKWMGAPNGTGFLYVRKDWQNRLKPVAIGDRFFNPEFSFAHRFEWPGTCDVVRFRGLEAALRLQRELGPQRIAARQRKLQKYLREALESELPSGTVRTPFVEGESTGMFVINWQAELLLTKDLRESLWSAQKIWTQPDYAAQDSGTGMRISCHVFNTESDIDALIRALKPQFQSR